MKIAIQLYDRDVMIDVHFVDLDVTKDKPPIVKVDLTPLLEWVEEHAR